MGRLHRCRLTGAGEDQQRPPDLHPVTASQLASIDTLPIDQRPVAAAQIDQFARAANLVDTDLGMRSRRLLIEQLNFTRGVPTDSLNRTLELKVLALVAAAYDEQ